MFLTLVLYWLFCLFSQVRLAEELDASSSRVCQLQQEADGLQQRVTDLQEELSVILQESQNHCALISSLESKVEGRGLHLPSGCLLIKIDGNFRLIDNFKR